MAQDLVVDSFNVIRITKNLKVIPVFQMKYRRKTKRKKSWKDSRFIMKGTKIIKDQRKTALKRKIRLR